MRSLLLSLACLAGLTTSAFAQWPPQPLLEQRQIAENIWTMQHPLGASNSTFIVTEEGVLVWDARACSAATHSAWAAALCTRLLALMLRRVVAAAEAALASVEVGGGGGGGDSDSGDSDDGAAAAAAPPAAVRGAVLGPALATVREQCFQLLRIRVRVFHLPLHRIFDSAVLLGAGGLPQPPPLHQAAAAAAANTAGAGYLVELAAAVVAAARLRPAGAEHLHGDDGDGDGDDQAGDGRGGGDVAAARAAAAAASDALAGLTADARAMASPFAVWQALSSPLRGGRPGGGGGAALPYTPQQVQRNRGLAAVQPEPFATALHRVSELFRFCGGTPLHVYAGAHRAAPPLALLRDLLARAHVPFVSLLRADLGN